MRVDAVTQWPDAPGESIAPNGVTVPVTWAATARIVLVAEPGTFGHEQARAISRWALQRERADLVVIDLSRAGDATTAAFAALVLLRRDLLRRGRDLRLTGLSGRTHQIYSVNRLNAVLPTHPPPRANANGLRAAAA